MDQTQFLKASPKFVRAARCVPIALLCTLIAVAILGAEDLPVQGRGDKVEWERSSLSRAERDLSPIAAFRYIEAPKGLSKERALFGTSIKIVNPTPEMAKLYQLDRDCEEHLYAWVGAPTAAKSKTGNGGAVTLVNLNTGENFGTIYSTENYNGHGFGYALKLSSDGKHLGIESAGGPAAVLHQDTGDLVFFRHPDFDTYIKGRNGEFKKDVHQSGKPVYNGSRLEFLPGELVLVTGVRQKYNASSQPAGAHASFHLFDMQGMHLRPLYATERDTRFQFWSYACYTTTGPRVIFKPGTDSVFYACPGLVDTGLSRLNVNGTWANGRVGAFSLAKGQHIDMTLFPDSQAVRSGSGKLGEIGHLMAMTDKRLVVTQHYPAGYADKYDPSDSGKLHVLSIDGPTSKLVGEIGIGASLGESIEITAMTPKDDRFLLVAYRTVFSEDRDRNKLDQYIHERSFLGVCDLENLRFQKIEDFELEGTDVLGITSMVFNPVNRTGIIFGHPSHNGGMGRLMEIDFKPDRYDEYFYRGQQ